GPAKTRSVHRPPATARCCPTSSGGHVLRESSTEQRTSLRDGCGRRCTARRLWSCWATCPVTVFGRCSRTRWAEGRRAGWSASQQCEQQVGGAFGRAGETELEIGDLLAVVLHRAAQVRDRPDRQERHTVGVGDLGERRRLHVRGECVRER